MITSTNSPWGDLRASLANHDWHGVVEVLATWPRQEGLHEQALPYCERVLATWPTSIHRQAYQPVLNQVSDTKLHLFILQNASVLSTPQRMSWVSESFDRMDLVFQRENWSVSMIHYMGDWWQNMERYSSFVPVVLRHAYNCSCRTLDGSQVQRSDPLDFVETLHTLSLAEWWKWSEERTEALLDLFCAMLAGSSSSFEIKEGQHSDEDDPLRQLPPAPHIVLQGIHQACLDITFIRPWLHLLSPQDRSFTAARHFLDFVDQGLAHMQSGFDPWREPPHKAVALIMANQDQGVLGPTDWLTLPWHCELLAEVVCECAGEKRVLAQLSRLHETLELLKHCCEGGT